MGSLLPSKLQPTVSSTLCSHWFPHHIHLPCNQSLFSLDSKLPFAPSPPLCVQSCDTHHVQDDQSWYIPGEAGCEDYADCSHVRGQYGCSQQRRGCTRGNTHGSVWRGIPGREEENLSRYSKRTEQRKIVLHTTVFILLIIV